MRRRVPLAPGPGPRRKSWMPGRSAPLAAVSAGRRRGQREQGRAYREAPTSEWCEVCGVPGDVEHSHLLTQGNHKQHRNSPLNWLLVGKWCDCHRIWEHNKREFARRFPDTWALILDRISQVGGPQALAFFQLKNPW